MVSNGDQGRNTLERASQPREGNGSISNCATYCS